VTSGEFPSRFSFRLLVLEQRVSSHRMRADISVVVMSTTLLVSLP
jgi:hypothetical protein